MLKWQQKIGVLAQMLAGSRVAYQRGHQNHWQLKQVIRALLAKKPMESCKNNSFLKQGRGVADKEGKEASSFFLRTVERQSSETASNQTLEPAEWRDG